MPGARSVRAGEAVVELYGDDSRLQRDLRVAGRRLRRFGYNARRIGAGVFAGVAGTAGPIAALSVRAASEANEIRNRFQQVFREQAGQAGQFADELGEQVGRSGTKLRGSLSDYMGFFVGMGFGRDQARELSQAMTALALDFGSFNNLSDQEANQRFISALSGSSEVVDRFGINLKAANLGLELQRLGLAKSTLTATEAQKAVARYSIIARSLGEQGAVGDAIRTAFEFANMQRRVRDETFDLADEIGQVFIPTATEALKVVSGTLGGLTQWVKENGDLVLGIGKLAAVVAVAAGSVFALGVAATILANPIALAAAGAGALVLAIGGIAEGTGIVDRLSASFGDAAAAAKLAGVVVLEALSGGQFQTAFKALALGFGLAFIEVIDELADYLSTELGTAFGFSALIDSLSATVRAKLETMRIQLGADAPASEADTGVPPWLQNLIDSLAGGSGAGRGDGTVRGLTGSLVVNRLAGASVADPLTKDVRSIASAVTAIARSAQDLGRYT